MVSRKNRSRNGRAKKTQIYVGSMVIGHVKGNTFYKTITGSIHILRYPRRSICLSRSSIRDASHAGATQVEILDREDGTVYTTTFEKFLQGSFPVVRGSDSQLGLPLDRWSANGEVPVAERRAREAVERRKAVQLSLFVDFE